MSEPRQHTCDVCGRTAPWGSAWQWWGSDKQAEDGRAHEIIKTCSDPCRKRLRWPPHRDAEGTVVLKAT